MRLIFLHGGPASGKLTVAQGLLRIVPGRLFDNHAAIDVSRTVFEFGAPGFWELVHSVRLSVITAAAAQGIPVVVVTYCYAEPDDRPAFEEIDAIVQRHGGKLLPVHLRCSEEEAARRVGNEDRAKRRKITSANGLREFLSRYRMSPVPRADCLRLDSEARSAEATAQEIVRHFGLEAPEPAADNAGHQPVETRLANVSDVPVATGLPQSVPNPIKPELFAGRHEARLGSAVGLTQFGVNHVVLEPGAISALRHWHESEDEFVYVVSGELALIDDNGEHVLTAGCFAGFPAGRRNAHHLINRSNAAASFMVVGTRHRGRETIHYPDDRLGPVRVFRDSRGNRLG